MSNNEEQPVEVQSRESSLRERTASETFGLIGGVLGTTAIVFGVSLYAIDPRVLPVSLGNFTFGAVAIALYILTNRKNFGRSVMGRSTAFLVLEVGVVFGLVAVVAVINYFAAQNPTEWDLTRDRLYTLHEQSQQVAASLDQDVEVIGFFRPSEKYRAEVTQRVDLYRRHTDRIRLKFVNPDTAPREMVEKFDLSSISPRIVVTAENGQFAKVDFPSEEALTNAFIKVAQQSAKKVYFLTGHGEPPIEPRPRMEEGFAAAASGLRNEGFVVEALALVDKANVPADANVVIVAGARSTLFPNEVEALKVYLDRGGRVLVLIDPGYEYGLQRVFGPYGVEVGDNLVIDPNPATRAEGYGPTASIVREFEAHPITNKLDNAAVLFPTARSVQPRLNLAQIEVNTLVRTGPTSWGETGYRESSAARRDETDIPGPVPIAVAVTRNTAGQRRKFADQARLVVIGDQGFITNFFLSKGRNRDLFLNTINWLAGEEDRITIRPRQRSGNHLALTPNQQNGIMFFSVNLLPLLIIGFGFSVWAIRQRQ